MLRKIAFTLFIVVTLVLVVATIVEKYEGTSFVGDAIYGAWWFYILWTAMALYSALYICKIKLYKRLSSFMLHLSFLLILLGAITTALTSQRGVLYLPYGQEQSYFQGDDNAKHSLPFSISLSKFEVEYYSGTSAPADYIGHITFLTEDGVEIEARVSMNNIAKYKGYRLYQSSYDSGGSWLTINRDVYGIPITYCGYILLALSFLWMLVDPQGAFRALLRSPILRKSATIIAFVLCSLTSTWAAPSSTPQTLSIEQCEALEDIQVVYNDRVMPITTLARDFTLKLTGDNNYKDASFEQFFWGWLLFPSQWQDEAIFEVPQSDKQRFLALRPLSSYADFFTEKGIYKLNHYMRNTEQKSEPALHKELIGLNEKIQLVAMLRSGALIKIFPYESKSGKINWYSPIDSLPSDMERGQALFIKNSFDMLLSAYATGNNIEFGDIASKIISYQQKYGGDSLIVDIKVRAEKLYYSLSITEIMYRFNLLLGIVAIIILVIGRSCKSVEKFVGRSLRISMIHAVALLALYIGLRWFITGRIPLVNGYDTMIFLGWCVAIMTLLISRASALFSAMGTILVGFTMLVATIGGLNPQITPLIPVLNSPFLSTHVCCIMLSYALFAFTFINGILSVTLGRGDDALVERLTIYSRIFLMIGLAFLAVGIFIGAVWANVSWGRYWAWDPKEVWALITMMIYSMPLHSNSLKIFRSPKIFHIYLIIAFASVLMTYFGVNYILGGMHSYVNG